MKVINPFGRSLKMEEVVGASLLGTACRCNSNSGLYYTVYIDNNRSCACTDGNGTVGTRVHVG